MPKFDFVVHTDGGARGNPGPAAIGYVLHDADGALLVEHGETIGRSTNNIAEYRAVVAALTRIKEILGDSEAAKVFVEVRMDSELIVKQLSGEYRVRDAFLKGLFGEVQRLIQAFASVRFQHVPRTQNKEADKLVNESLDAKNRLT